MAFQITFFFVICTIILDHFLLYRMFEPVDLELLLHVR